MGKLRFRQVHLDFHTSEKIRDVAADFNPAEFARVLKQAGVDSVTCFARCHHGMIYYDTSLPARHPGLHRDLLREQIDACHAEGIRVPIYITVGWDEYIAARHPEWLERTAEGKPYGAGPLEAGWRTLCFNTPYVDYVKQQTVEVLQKFGKDVDGLFFDIIFQDPCCCSYCMEGMLKEGYRPEIEADRRNYAEKVLARFKFEMTETVRKYNNSCTIFYNAGHVNPAVRKTLDAYTHLELESLPSGGWGYEHFPVTVRFAKNLGKEYLGMTGKFHKSWADFGGFKNQPALEYECFMALANGAKCSIGDQLHPDGRINRSTYELIGSVYRQVAEKEPWCDDAESVSEIGVFTPEAIGRSRGRVDPSISGVYRMLEEAHLQFDIIDHGSHFEKYRLIILPDLIVLDERLKTSLYSYLDKGGKVLLSYKSGMAPDEKGFTFENIGVEFVSEAGFSPDYIKAEKEISEGIFDTEHVMYDRGLWVKASEGSTVLAQIYNPYFNREYSHFCSHRQTPPEKDSGFPAAVLNKSRNVLYFSHPVFSMYHKHGAKVYRQLVINALKQMLPESLIKTGAPTTAHMNLNYQPGLGRYVLHILHYIPERRFEDIDIIEDIIPLYDTALKIKLPQRPGKVYCAPSMKVLDADWENGYAAIRVPEVKGHQMVVFEFNT